MSDKTTRRGFLGAVAAIAAAPAAAAELFKTKPKPEPDWSEYTYDISAPCDENGWLQYAAGFGDDIELHDVVELSGPADSRCAMGDNQITVRFLGDGDRLNHCVNDGLMHYTKIHLPGTVAAFNAFLTKLDGPTNGAYEANFSVSGVVTWTQGEES